MANNYTRNGSPRCSFCGKDASMVERLISGPNVYICNECIDLCNDILEGEAMPVRRGGRPPKDDGAMKAEPVKLMLPTEMKKVLDDYVIGQERAKRAMCVAV